MRFILQTDHDSVITKACRLLLRRYRRSNVQTSNVWKKVGFVNGNGNTLENSFYHFTDRGLIKGKYTYRLKQIDFNGNFEYHNLSNEVIVGLPEKFSLSQNYPNPFNPSTKINYDLPFDANVSLKVFDMTGREVITIVNEFKTAGYYVADFHAFESFDGSVSVQDFSRCKRAELYFGEENGACEVSL
jgi:hypothetical protein